MSGLLSGGGITNLSTKVGQPQARNCCLREISIHCLLSIRIHARSSGLSCIARPASQVGHACSWAAEEPFASGCVALLHVQAACTHRRIVLGLSLRYETTGSLP